MGVLIGNKIFIQGGYTSVLNNVAGPATNEMIVLPIDQSFQLSNPPYEADSGTMPGSPAVLGQANFYGGYNNSGFYMFGGQISNSSGRVEISTLYMFNTTHYNWTVNPQTTGQWPEPRDSASGISHRASGSGYIFGGEPLVTGSSWLFNTTWRLQYGNSWSEVGGSAPGGGRQSHAVAMLTDGRMVILGGSDGAGNAIPLTQVLVFDTNAGTYTLMNATLSGSNPVARLAHTVVSTFDDKIIVHGGDGGNGKFLADIAVLDMKQSTLAWTVPTTSGTAPSGRLAHTAVMVGTQMFIMYGQTGASNLDNGVYALDTTSWAWQSTYTPNNLNYTNTGVLAAPAPGSDEPSTQNAGNGITNSNGSNGNTSGSGGSGQGSNGGGGNGTGSGGGKTSNTSAIIGGSVGGVALVLILAALAAFAWLRNRKRKGDPQKTSVYPLPGTDSHRAYFSNNAYDTAPPYYQQNAPWNNGQKTSVSLHNDSSGEFASNPTSNTNAHPLPIPMSNPTAFHHDAAAQKPNTPIEFQKPNAGE
ncbi:hypothetical protein BC943DRAFT_360224 [Umbelopsis sp. AD052]|nr:hypothetical protein BC943DRAFT_360224 [Umbelopsis sp. AD052]